MMFSRRLLSTFSLPPTIRQLLAIPVESQSPTVTVSGWIKSIRRQKNLTFAVITDGSSPHGLQAILVGDAAKIKPLTNGAAVRLSGKLVASPGSGQEKELFVNLGKAGQSTQGELDVLGPCDPETYPIQKQALSPEYLRDHSHLRARTDAIAAMIRLRHQLKRNIDSHFEGQGFCYTHTPILTGIDAEGAGETFKLEKTSAKHPSEESSRDQLAKEDFFDRPAYLTVSHQLHLEAVATALSRVYTLSPCFRAEPSQTGRHLAEFLMLEAEWAFGGATLDESTRVDHVCDFVETSLKDVVGGCLSNDADLQVLWKTVDEERQRALVKAITGHEPWLRVTYSEAIKILQESSHLFQFKPEWGLPLQSEHERWLANMAFRSPLFITDYPKDVKAFYMRSNPPVNGLKTVACVDLIVPHIGELVGGSVREDRLDELNIQLGEEAAAYRWYLDLRRFGGAPHAGFGMGFERLVSWVAGIDNIREAIPFPRWAGRMLL